MRVAVSCKCCLRIHLINCDKTEGRNPAVKEKNITGSAAQRPAVVLKGKTNIDSTGMIKNLPVGVCRILMDEAFTLVFGNERFFAMYQRTPEQIERELQNSMIGMIMPEDLQLVNKTVWDAKEAGRGGFRSEHRILCRDGSVRWALVEGNFLCVDGLAMADCIVVDITDRKKIEEEIRINEERFRLALAQTDNTIFDYNIETRVMIHAYRSAEMYGIPNHMENVPDSLVENRTIHPDTVEPFLEMYRKIREGAHSASCVVRTRLVKGRYLWRKITLTNIYDDEGKAVRAIGILEDVEEQKRREELLRDQLERDTLTGLFNRGGIETKIRSFLAEPPDQTPKALLVIDIDLFKNVNDHYGHLFGDHVLAEAAGRISKLFRRDDIAGRIGGDEFIVFVKSIRDAQETEKRARAICTALFESEFENNGIYANVTCSVGAALWPEDGESFEELYQKADIALYEAKKKGRNQACLYAHGMGDEMEWTPYSSTRIDG